MVTITVTIITNTSHVHYGHINAAICSTNKQNNSNCLGNKRLSIQVLAIALLVI